MRDEEMHVYAYCAIVKQNDELSAVNTLPRIHKDRNLKSFPVLLHCEILGHNSNLEAIDSPPYLCTWQQENLPLSNSVKIFSVKD